MDCKHKAAGSKKDCLAYLKQVVDSVHKGELVIEDNNIEIPEGYELVYAVKYAEDPGETKLSIKVKWPNDIPIPEEVEEEV